jgi:hypothetical protein
VREEGVEVGEYGWETDGEGECLLLDLEVAADRGGRCL